MSECLPIYLPMTENKMIFVSTFDFSIFKPMLENMTEDEKYSTETFDKKEAILLDKNKEYTRKKYEEMGIEIVKDAGLQDYEVVLPNGWTKKHDGGYWSKVCDEKDRQRMSIFMKSAIYDSDSFVNFEQRLDIAEVHDYKESDFREGYEKYSQPLHYSVIDCCGKILFKTESTSIGRAYSEKEHYVFFHDLDALRQGLYDTCVRWLKENYPDWENPTAYWDIEC